jgi:Spy/CpxP family protein refolding chaperone
MQEMIRLETQKNLEYADSSKETYMKTRNCVHAALAASVFLALATYAPAQPGQGVGQGAGEGFGSHRPPMERALGPDGPHGRWWNDAQTIDRLKLTDDQRKSMDDILLQHRETLIDMRATVDKAELAMQPLMSADQPNESEILAQIDKVAQARAELEKANARFLLAIRGKLSPEQWKSLQAMRNERHTNGMQQHRQWQNRQGPPPQGGFQGAPSGPPPAGPGEL